ncbi:MAG: hypothetical protein IJO81_02570 [Clostridia bacterium]|nr:hypothetical protein [Clostridia bacterium]
MMKNRSFLPLMEILLTIAVFAIASVICLQGFTKANDISKRRSELDAAVLLAQDTCEVLKYSRGDMDLAAELTEGKVTDGGMVIYRDVNGVRFTVKVTSDVSNGGIGKANVTVSTSARDVYELNVAWQR